MNKHQARCDKVAQPDCRMRSLDDLLDSAWNFEVPDALAVEEARGSVGIGFAWS